MRGRMVLIAAVLWTLGTGPAAAQTPVEISDFQSLFESTDVPEPLRKQVTVAFHGATLEDALKRTADQAGLELTYSRDYLPQEGGVALQLRQSTARDVFRRLLLGSGLDLLVSPAGRAVIVRKDGQESAAVSGRVTDASTGSPISGAEVRVVGTSRQVQTDREGLYQVTGLAAASVVLRVSALGYRVRESEVDLAPGQTTTLDLALEPRALLMDEIVVTGSMIPTELRGVPTPVGVVDQRDFERHRPQRVDDILRGMVAGVSAQDIGAADYFSSISLRGAADLSGSTTVKVYVDGVEMANPTAVANLDPTIIERVEVIRGPQASTLYGSDAIGGVIQIFTKKGSRAVTDPQVEAKVSVGMIESKFGDGAVEQDHSVSITGGEDAFAFNLSGAYRQSGEWVEEAHNDQLEIFGSGRGELGRLRLSFTGRFHGRTLGLVRRPDLKEDIEALGDVKTDAQVRQQTVGVTAEYPVTDRWTHRLTLGYDRNLLELLSTDSRNRFPGDTLLALINTASTSKASADYQSSIQVGDPTEIGVTVIGGLNAWEAETQLITVQNVPNNRGTLDGLVSPPIRDRFTNFGGWLQAHGALADQVFLTAGLRAEDNENFGPDYGLAWAPRVGGTVVLEPGDVTLKLRGSWGRAIKPPSSSDRLGSVTSRDIALPAPDLGPEIQAGWDAGADVQLGRDAAVSVTYYDQTAEDLIDGVLLETRPDGIFVYQNQNIGVLDNEGWEVEAEWRPGKLGFQGSYSRSTSEVRALSPDYAGDLQVGDTPVSVPEWTSNFTVSYGPVLSTTTAVTVTGLGPSTNLDWIALYGAFLGDDPFRGAFRDYWITYPASWKVNLNVSRDFSDRMSAFVQVRNLTNRQEPERLNTDVLRGRVTTVGVRARW